MLFYSLNFPGIAKWANFFPGYFLKISRIHSGIEGNSPDNTRSKVPEKLVVESSSQHSYRWANFLHELIKI